MSKAIAEYIQQLKELDEQMYNVFKRKKKLQPDFQMNCDYNYVFDVSGKCLFVSLFILENNEGVNNSDDPDLSPYISSDIVKKGIKSVHSSHSKAVIKKEMLDGNYKEIYKKVSEYIFTPLYGDNKYIEGILCTIRNSECRLSEIRENDYVGNLNCLLEITPTAICVVDSNGIFLNGNQPFIDLMFPGMSKQELLGKDADFLKEMTGIEWIQTPCYQALHGEYTENCYGKFSGYDLLINSAPIKDTEGNVVAAVSAFNNITKYENMRKEIVRLDRLNLISEMAAGVAHEIRNPLTVIKGYLQYIKRTISDELAKKIDIIFDEFESIEIIISDFLSLAKNKQTRLQQQNLNNIIQSIYPLIYTNAIKSNVYMELQLDENLSDILLDAEEMKQLLLNLSRNSIEAMQGRKGKVVITTKEEKENILFSIADQGCGISEDVCKDIFTPFFTTKDTGTGLGLSICASIVERHNGTIKVKTKKNEGTCFIISIPKRGGTGTEVSSQN